MAAHRPLTPRQRDVLDAIRAGIHANGLPPMLHEIGAAVGLTKGTVSQHVRALAAAGYVRHRPGAVRAIQLCDAAPHLGRVLARLRIDVPDTPPAAGPTCKAGHPRTPDNTWTVAGLDLCLACGRADVADYLAAKAAAKAVG